MPCRPTGLVRMDFHDGEEFTWNPLVTTVQHIILGTHYLDHTGTLHVQSSVSALSSRVRFKEPFIAFSDKQVHQVCCKPHTPQVLPFNAVFLIVHLHQ